MLTNKHLRELRKFLKAYKATALDEQHQEQADIVTGLIPALVDSITDEELTSLMFTFSDYLMNTIINPAPTEPLEAKGQPAAPLSPSIVITDN